MSVLSQLTLPVLDESTQEVENRQFDLSSGGVSSNTYTVLDTESSTINNSDFVPMSEYDSDKDVYTKKKVTWSNIIAKIKNALPTTVPSHVGQVIESTTLSTLAQVRAVYGTNTTWIQLSGYVLRGATSSVTANSNQKDGGDDNLIVPYHRHSFTPSGNISGGAYTFSGSAVTSGAASASSTGTQSANHTHTVNGGATTTGTQSANHTHSGTTSSNTVKVGYGSGGSSDGAVIDKRYIYSTAKYDGAINLRGSDHTHTMTTGNNSVGHTHSQVAHTHSVGNNSANHTHDMKHTHSVTASGSVSVKTNPSFTGSAGNTGYVGTNGNTINANIPNYKNVYIWERTV